MRSTCLRLNLGQRRAEPGEGRRAESWFFVQPPWIQLLLKLPDTPLVFQLHEPFFVVLFKPIWVSVIFI